MVLRIVFSVIFLVSCDYASSGKNDLLDYSQPRNMLNYSKFTLSGHSFVEGDADQNVIEEIKLSPTFKNNEFVYIVSDDPDIEGYRFVNTTHVFQRLSLSYDDFISFQGIDSVKLEFEINSENSNDYYGNLTYLFSRLYIQREDKMTYQYIHNPDEYLARIVDSSYKYKFKWEFGFMSGKNDWNSTSGYYNEENTVTQSIKIKLNSILF